MTQFNTIVVAKMISKPVNVKLRNNFINTFNFYFIKTKKNEFKISSIWKNRVLNT